MSKIPLTDIDRKELKQIADHISKLYDTSCGDSPSEFTIECSNDGVFSRITGKRMDYGMLIQAYIETDVSSGDELTDEYATCPELFDIIIKQGMRVAEKELGVSEEYRKQEYQFNDYSEASHGPYLIQPSIQRGGDHIRAEVVITI